MTEVFRAGRYEVPVLYLDNQLLVVEKPVNMPVQADASLDLDLLTSAKAFIGEKYHKPGAVYLGLVHRLDRPVGGVTVLARTSKAAERLSRAFAGHTVLKRYLAVARGEIERETRLIDCLVKDPLTGMVKVVGEGTSGAKRAELITRPIAFRDGLTLSEVELMTGRAHQIRVQHMHAGHPLWGDARYGNGQRGEQVALWARALTLEHPTLKESMTFTSMPPRTGAWAHFLPELEAMDEGT